MVDAAAKVAERLLTAAIEMTDLMAVAVGDRLGYYRLLNERGPLCSPELAAATGTPERYAREWLEQQAVTGLLEVQNETLPPSARRFRLADGVAQVLATPDDLSFLAPLARQMVAAAAQVPAVVQAVRAGRGVPWSFYGADMRESEADLTRPAYLHLLAQDWLPALPDVQQRLLADPPARVADVGCGGGWSAIALAQGFPQVHVDAFDLDAASVELARHNVAQTGLTDRVHVHQQDIGEVSPASPYDLVTAFECLHDLPYPVQALSAMRRLAEPDGTVLIVDMKVADTFTAPGHPIERLMYGFSLSICLPDSMSSPGSAATGTVLRQDTVRRYAQEAGFPEVETLPIEHDFWRFYRLGRQTQDATTTPVRS